MKKTDLAYLAGFFDGEGTLFIEHLSLKRSNSYRLRVSVGQTNRWILERYRMAFGGSVRLNRVEHGNHKPLWQWQVSCKAAGEFLKAIYPYLILKQSEAKVALEFQAKQTARGPGRKKMSAQESAVQEAQQLLIHNLKDKSKY